ncbi:MAG: helix-turn-helix domain-containing protein [Azoarcus sp.]|jgi:DNA-binding IclR family transcriptional regulator|nr:helix-turn-helix domain-containing protein [Azoarcus sp.]
MRAAHTAIPRALALVEALAGHEVTGMRLRDISAAVGVIESTALRDLRRLESSGWAQQMEDGRWRLASRPIQCLLNFQNGLAEAENRVAEVRRNYTRTPSL